MADYVKNADLMRAIMESKEKGVLTPETIAMFYLMINGISKKMAYKDPEDKADCMAFAMEDLCKYWNRFDPAKSNNPFAYYTQIAKNGFAKGWKRSIRQRHLRLFLSPTSPERKILTTFNTYVD